MDSGILEDRENVVTDKDKERLESIKAAFVSAVIGKLAGLSISFSQLTSGMVTMISFHQYSSTNHNSAKFRPTPMGIHILHTQMSKFVGSSIGKHYEKNGRVLRANHHLHSNMSVAQRFDPRPKLSFQQKWTAVIAQASTSDPQTSFL